MIRIIFILLLLGVLVIPSCKPSVEKEKVAEINEQISQVDRTVQDFRAIDTALLFDQYAQLVGNIRYIQKNYVDTMNLETAQFLARYQRLANLIADYRNFAAIEEGILISKDQLENLKHDYVNEIINEEKFNEYFTAELNRFFKLEEKTSSMINNWEEFKQKFSEYNPKVDSIVSKIKAKRSRSLKL